MVPYFDSLIVVEENAWYHILTHCCGRECMVPYLGLIVAFDNEFDV